MYRPSPTGHDRPRRPTATRALLTTIVLTSLVLAACGGSGEPAGGANASTGSADPGAYPVTMTHAFGDTTIDAEPERVVTWGWASADAAIALGVVPVAIPFATYGADDEGVLPWIREALEEDGIEVPTILPSTAEEVPFEAIAAAKPDLILAVYSGITDTDYDKLSQIAPTVAYPDEAWSTPWRDTIELVGTALGRSEAATAVLADIDAEVAAEAEAHPELEGKTVAMVWPDLEEFYVYKPADARVAFTLDLGLVSAPSVEELSSGGETFFFTLSTERLGELESDVLVSYADTQQQAEMFVDAPAAQLMQQVRDGTVAQVTGPEFIAVVSPPTALSLTWGLEDYVALLSDAAKAADAAG